MSTTQAALPRPDFGRLYGITYDPGTKAPMIRVPRVLKVGIGIPKGKAIQVFKFNGRWHIRHGVWEKNPGGKDKLVMRTVYQGGAIVKVDGKDVEMPNTKEAAEAWHNANKDKAAVSNRPQKQPFFGFTRRTVVEDASGKPTEFFEPDFDAIDAHGDCPRRIEVILTSESPLRQEDQWWTASELKCHGDGLLGERVLSAGSAKDEWWQQAKDAGLKMFPYAPCRLNGCPHAGVDCKQHSTLELQLAYALRLGATAYFTSTGQVTADQLHSSLMSIRVPLEKRGYSIVGIPMHLVLGSFKANHEGKPTIQPCVSLELTAAGAKALNQLLSENSWVPARIGTSPRQITGAADQEMTYDAPTEALAPAIAAEFTDAEYDEDVPEDAATPPPVATATAAKQAEVSERLKKAKEKKDEPAPAAPAVADVPTATQLWADKGSMDTLFISQRHRVGPDAFSKIFADAGTNPNSLKHDSTKAAELYAAVLALPGLPQPGVPVEPLNDDLF